MTKDRDREDAELMRQTRAFDDESHEQVDEATSIGTGPFVVEQCETCVVPFGDKENVLGTRWIRLVPNGKTSRQVSGLGIHGTWDPTSIGKAESNGCLRLLNKDVEELFAIIPNERKPIPVTIIN